MAGCLASSAQEPSGAVWPGGADDTCTARTRGDQTWHHLHYKQ